MSRVAGVAVVAAFLLIIAGGARAARAQDANAVIDKGIQALGGQEKLAKVKAASWTSKGTITFGGSDNAATIHHTVQGMDQMREEFDGNFGGMQVKGVGVLSGDKGWRVFAGMKMPLDKDAVADEKRSLYVTFVPMTLVALKGSAF